ncbi:MAG: hypothetical protein RL091_3248, partial [Verrucomicrobiota bacterium]
ALAERIWANLHGLGQGALEPGAAQEQEQG